MRTKGVKLITIKKVRNYGKIAHIPVGYTSNTFLKTDGGRMHTYPSSYPAGFAPGWWKGAWHNAPLNTLLVDTYNHMFSAFFSRHKKNDLHSFGTNVTIR